ncbi:major facilitator superfamily domain-containing protein 10 [Clonorchis sinensis]|uniref:Major facilitator superfamily domain-containing protein 10 n=1 Tax=Clonorchis sinensis TaxID=79923 RepID=G7YL18_CLOSI|nr:major facilitator superfamily domain-containing protein 10 [Clonorchis sinensis]
MNYTTEWVRWKGPVQLDTTFRLLDPRNLFSFQGVSADKKVINRLWEWSIIWFVFLLIFSGLESTVLFLTRSRFGFTGRDQGHIFLFLGIVMLIVQGGLVHRFRHGNEAKVSSLAIFVLALAALIIGTSQLWWVFYIGLAFWGFSSASFMPTFNGMVSLQTGPERQVCLIWNDCSSILLFVNLFAVAFGYSGWAQITLCNSFRSHTAFFTLLEVRHHTVLRPLGTQNRSTCSRVVVKRSDDLCY